MAPADNHGEGTGELTAAALHTVLDGKAKVHKTEDDEDAAEGGHTIREKVFTFSSSLIPFLFTCFLVTVQMGKGDTGKSRDDDCNGFAYLPAPTAKKSREGHPKIDDSHDGECARSGSYRRGGEFDECFQVPSSIRPLSAFFAWHFS